MPPEAAETEATAVETPTAPATNPEATERDALIAAVDAAQGKEPTKVEPAKADPEAPPTESKVAAVLRAREQAQAARDDASKAKEEAAAARAEIAAMRAEAEKDRASARAEMEKLQKLRSAPLAAIKELGWDTRQLVDEVTREGSPEWQAQKRYEAALEKTNSELAEMKAWREEQKEHAKRQEQQQRTYGRQQVEQKFLSSFPAESAARALYEEHELVAKGDAVADAYREKTGGKVASIEEIRDYLEEQAAVRLAAIRQQPGGVTSQAPAVAAKIVHQPRANGPRALSGTAASERRASPKPRHEWSEDDLRAEMKAAAEAAMK